MPAHSRPSITDDAWAESALVRDPAVWQQARLPLVELFETVEGEGTRAGFPTVFVRLFGCPLRCTWCDTPYSYPPDKPQRVLSVAEIREEVGRFPWRHVCVTGGEPLMYAEKSAMLLAALASLPHVVDVHVETSGAVAIAPFLAAVPSEKVRYIVDYKLPASGEEAAMVTDNLRRLRPQDELKFVIADEDDFRRAVEVLNTYRPRGQVLFSPVWDTMPPRRLVELILAHGLAEVKLNLQLHKVIWDPQARGV